MGQADLDLLPILHDCPAHGDRKFVRTDRRYRAIEIQVGPTPSPPPTPAERPTPRHRNDRPDR